MSAYLIESTTELFVVWPAAVFCVVCVVVEGTDKQAVLVGLVHVVLGVGAHSGFRQVGAAYSVSTSVVTMAVEIPSQVELDSPILV